MSVRSRAETCRCAVRACLAGRSTALHPWDIRAAVNAYGVHAFTVDEVKAALSFLLGHGLVATSTKPFGCVTYYREAGGFHQFA